MRQDGEYLAGDRHSLGTRFAQGSKEASPRERGRVCMSVVISGPGHPGAGGLRGMVRGLAQPFAAHLIRQRTGFFIVPLDRRVRQSTIRPWASIAAKWK